MLDAMGVGLKATRDRALLLIGFAGGLRRSELVGLDVGDIEHMRQGIVPVSYTHLPLLLRSGTDCLLTFVSILPVWEK